MRGLCLGWQGPASGGDDAAPACAGGRPLRPRKARVQRAAALATPAGPDSAGVACPAAWPPSAHVLDAGPPAPGPGCKPKPCIRLQVGAGALGCEFLKNFALMGVACGEVAARLA